jgi:hypothetical protein
MASQAANAPIFGAKTATAHQTIGLEANRLSAAHPQQLNLESSTMTGTTKVD